MGKILVTGASGNVGRYVMKHAVARSQNVIAASTHPERLSAFSSPLISTARLDFKDPTSFAVALEDVDRVFIMRPPAMGNPQDLYPFIDALTKLPDLKLVCFLSLLGIEHNPIPPHHKIERYIEKSGLPYCHLRPSFFMQNLSDIHAFEIKHFDRIMIPVGKTLTSFIDAEDIGAFAAKVFEEPLKHQKTAYSLTGPEALDYFEVAKTLSKTLNRTIVYANPSRRFAKKYWTDVRGLDNSYATVMSMLYLMTKMGTAKTVNTTYADIMHEQPTTLAEFAEKNRIAWER